MAAAGSTAGSESALSLLSDALKRFSRSIELCDDYLRGLYGLKLVSKDSQVAHHDIDTQSRFAESF